MNTTDLPSADVLVGLARPAPRYTSYPSVPHWHNDVESADLHAAVEGLDVPVALYLHIPFCWKHCWYCGCNMVVSGRQSAGDRFVAAITAQIEGLPLQGSSTPLARLHLGGGTPTWLSPEQLDRLFAAVWRRFTPVEGAERSIEVHPGVTTDAHLDALARAGFDRLSIGVQSTNPVVLESIGREQELGRIQEIATGARARGFTGLNLDLVYGLPNQTIETLDQTLDDVIALRPDRLALYGYAHVPWLRANQAKIDETALPDEVRRMELFLHATKRLRNAGWQAQGLDHFALPTDALCIAAEAGELSRDFMGYTDRRTPLIALGPSAISELDGLYAQQPPQLGAWYRAIEGGELLPVVRGHKLSEDDVERSDAIRELMCHLRLKRPFPKGAETRLGEWRDLGAITLDEDGLEVTELGRLLLRNVSACFDSYLGDGPAVWRVDPRTRAAAE